MSAVFVLVSVETTLTRSEQAMTIRKTRTTGTPRLKLEPLEDRTVPATVIVILNSGAGTLDGFLSATDGTIAAADGAGVPGSVSRAALQGVNATTGISITAEESILVNNLTSPLALQTGAGNTATFTASAGAINFTDTTDSISTSGGSITLNAITAGPLGGLSSGGGQITVNADDIALQGAINAGAGVVILRNSTVGRQIDLGTETAGKLSLTQAELNNVTSTGVLRIGDSSSGIFHVSAPINANAPIVRAALVLISGAAMTDTGTGAITSTNLRLSGTGPITLDGAHVVTNLVSNMAGSPSSGAVLFANTTPLTVGAAIDGISGITTINGNVTLAANVLNVAGNVNVGNTAIGGIVTFQPLGAVIDIDVGTETGGRLSLTDIELDRVFARVLRIGINTNLDIFVTAPITLGANVPTLSLIAGNTITDTGAGSLTVANLRASGDDGVTLDAAANNVGTLAGTTTTAGADFAFVDSGTGGFIIGTVDGVAGIDTVGPTDRITLTAGGAITQTAGANVNTTFFEVFGTGPVTLTNTGNDVVNFSANLTGAGAGITYVDFDALNIGIVSAAATAGITTNNGNISVTSGAGFAGFLTVQNDDGDASPDVNAGTGTVFLNANSLSGQDQILTILANAGVTGTGGVTLVADNMSIGAAVNAGTSTAFIRQFANGTLIDLGGADGTNTLGLTDAELDLFTTATLLIGDSNSGTITVSANITRPASTNVLLRSGAAILQLAGGGSINSNGGTLLVEPGTNYAPQRSANDVTASTTSFANGSDLLINITGATVDTQYTQLNVAGAVDLTGVDLALSGAFVPLNGTVFTIVSATSRTGTFNGLPEGATLAFGGKTLQVQYTATTVQLVVNTPPTISDVGNQSAFVNTPIGPVAFTINDAETPLANLTVTAKSSNTTLFTNGIVLGGSGGNRTVTLTPASGQSGTTTITLTVTDGNGAIASDTFNVTISTSSHNLAVGGPNQTASLFVPNASGTYGSPAATLAPFGAVAGSVRTATADVNNDGAEDTILVTGPGTPIRFAVVSGLNNTTLLIPPTAPFAGSEDFLGGGFVSAADLDGDGRAEIVITPDQGGGPRVTIFSLVGTTLTVKANFFGIDDPAFRGGARSALGDVNHDGKPDALIAAGFGGGPRVAIFDGATLLTTRTKLQNDFFAFPEDANTLRNGIFAALGDITGDGFADLIFGGGPGGAPRVFILSGQLFTSGSPSLFTSPVANFFVAGNANDRGGVRLAAKNADGDAKADLAVGSGEGSPANMRIYLGKNIIGGGEPSAFQDISVFGGGALTDGVFVG